MDMSYLHQLFDRPGPWVSVYLDATRAEQNADRQIQLHWRSLRDQLERQDADATTLDAVEAALRDHPYRPGRYGLAVFATAGEVALVEPMSAPPVADEAVFGPLPHAMPLVAQRVDEIPYVRALTDRTGAEVTGLAVDGSPRHEYVKGGEEYPIHKVRGGGWSNPRYQQAAEETWKRNAGDVAAAVAELAARVGAEVVVVAGDVRSSTLVTEKLPRRWRERVVVSHSSGEDDLDEVTVRAIAEVARRHQHDAIDRFNAQGPGPTGLADVVTRLQRGQADTVLLANDPSSTDRLWIGPADPSLIAVDAQTLRESGVDEPQQVRADAALLRAIVGTGADLVLVSPDEVRLTHGIGAVLRYPDGATAAS
jgi:hypothetical protein